MLGTQCSEPCTSTRFLNAVTKLGMQTQLQLATRSTAISCGFLFVIHVFAPSGMVSQPLLSVARCCGLDARQSDAPVFILYIVTPWHLKASAINRKRLSFVEKKNLLGPTYKKKFSFYSSESTSLGFHLVLVPQHVFVSTCVERLNVRASAYTSSCNMHFR